MLNAQLEISMVQLVLTATLITDIQAKISMFVGGQTYGNVVENIGGRVTLMCETKFEEGGGAYAESDHSIWRHPFIALTDRQPSALWYQVYQNFNNTTFITDPRRMTGEPTVRIGDAEVQTTMVIRDLDPYDDSGLYKCNGTYISGPGGTRKTLESNIVNLTITSDPVYFPDCVVPGKWFNTTCSVEGKPGYILEQSSLFFVSSIKPDTAELAATCTRYGLETKKVVRNLVNVAKESCPYGPSGSYNGVSQHQIMYRTSMANGSSCSYSFRFICDSYWNYKIFNDTETDYIKSTPHMSVPCCHGAVERSFDSPSTTDASIVTPELVSSDQPEPADQTRGPTWYEKIPRPYRTWILGVTIYVIAILIIVITIYLFIKGGRILKKKPFFRLTKRKVHTAAVLPSRDQVASEYPEGNVSKKTPYSEITARNGHSAAALSPSNRLTYQYREGDSTDTGMLNSQEPASAMIADNILSNVLPDLFQTSESRALARRSESESNYFLASRQPSSSFKTPSESSARGFRTFTTLTDLRVNPFAVAPTDVWTETMAKTG